MAGTDNAERVNVLVRLSPRDIRTIRSGLRVLLQIHTREEGCEAIREALVDLPSEDDLTRLEVDDQLQALARACREAGFDGESGLAKPCSDGEASSSSSTPPSRTRVTFPIVGLGCGGGGASTVERVLRQTPGVVRAYVNPATEMVYVEYDAARTDQSALERVINSLGNRVVATGRLDPSL